MGASGVNSTLWRGSLHLGVPCSLSNCWLPPAAAGNGARTILGLGNHKVLQAHVSGN